MSSFKNAKKSLQKTHRERAQPGKRKQFGLLEKHKDYVLRAKDFHRKETHLKLLREKARNKNPDEFYYKMINTKTSNGVHVVENKESYTADQLKMMKSQDLNYTRMKRAIERKKIEKLKSTLHLAQHEKATPPNSRTVFVDSKKEAKNFKTMIVLNKLPLDKVNNEIMESDIELEKGRKKAYEELGKRIKREKHLRGVEEGMELQKHLMGKGRRQKIDSGEGGGVVYKWKRQRKK